MPSGNLLYSVVFARSARKDLEKLDFVNIRHRSQVYKDL